MKGYRKYFFNKVLWLFVTLIFAFVLNFFLPRLMPGDPVAAIVGRLAQGMSETTGMKAVYERYAELFGVDKPMIQQFFIYVRNVLKGDFGLSFFQSIPETGSRYYRFFYLVDDWPAISGDHCGVDNWECARRCCSI